MAVPVKSDLSVAIFLGELAEHARHVEIRGIGARYDFIDGDLEHIARLRSFDKNRSGQGVRPAAGEIRAQLFDLFDGRARYHLIVAVHHCFQHNRVAGIHAQHRRLGIVEPTPLSGIERGRQQVHFLAAWRSSNAQLGIGRAGAGIGDG
jgi:hypothetical protein